MPLYDFKCPECGIETECFLTLDQKENHPPVCTICDKEMNPIITKMTIVSGVNLSNKLDEGFKDVMREVKKNHGPESTIDPDGGLMSGSKGTIKTEDCFGDV